MQTSEIHHIYKSIHFSVANCDPNMSPSHQRSARLTAEHMVLVWAEPVGARKAGPVLAVTSVCATHSASSTEPARTESASATRAGTESTAPLVSVPSCVRMCAFGLCLCVNMWVCTETPKPSQTKVAASFYFVNGIWK